ncbi:hypothetical protein WN55_10059 [Dufourea novaeangliae]|uniref:Ig-like domain-containing protein n=1 Tax=Dufourea novaeangliae TaxID=178035 RepID=A0A154PAD4_DUFNO|nr:hypothetical protein WN55_10059 [Dufourea novaeangliae]
MFAIYVGRVGSKAVFGTVYLNLSGDKTVWITRCLSVDHKTIERQQSLHRAFSEFQVSWVRRRGEELHLLTIGLDTYASDSRFSLAFESPNNWKLLLSTATERDGGLYECQVSAHPPLIRTVHLTVSGFRAEDSDPGPYSDPKFVSQNPESKIEDPMFKVQRPKFTTYLPIN